jgi:O-antigen ligase
VICPLVLFPLLIAQPVAGIAVSLGAVVCILASRSPAYPLALWAAPSIAIGILGSNPFPNNSVELFLVGWAVLAVLIALLRDPAALPLRFLLAPPVLLSVALAILMVARLGASEDPTYGSFKLQRFLAENLLFLVAGILIARRRRDFDLWAGLLLATTTLSALVVMQGLAADPSKFESVGGRFALYAEATPIGLGRDTAAAMLVGVYLILVTTAARKRLAALAALPILMIAFVASGSRGPLLGLLVGLVVLLALTLHDPASRRRVLLVAVAVLASAILIPQLVPGQNTSRVFSILVGNSSHESLSNGRVDQWSLAWQTFTGHPLAGIGTGGFSALSPEVYPHNILLEAASELGIFGLLFVLGLIVSTGVTLARVWRTGAARDRHRAALVSALAVAAVLNACVSGDIATNSFVWLAAGLTLGLAGELAPEAPLEPVRWAGGRLRRTRWAREVSGAARRPRLIPAPQNAMLAHMESGDPSFGSTPARRAAPVVLGIELDEVDVMLSGTTALHVLFRHPAAVRWVEYQVAKSGSHDWQPLSRVEQHPFALTLDTTRLPDGLYDFRALGVDRGGRVELSRPVRARWVANASREIVIREPAPGTWVRGVVTLAARVTDGSPVVFELSSDGQVWQTLPGHSWDTRGGGDGDYHLRAVGADGWGKSAPVKMFVDNTPPRIRLADPAGAVEADATVHVEVEVDDAGSGLLSVRFYGSYDGRVWHELVTLTRPPYAIALDTSAIEEGEYVIQGVARDRAGNDAATEPIRLSVERTEASLEPPPLPRRTRDSPLEGVTLWQLEQIADAHAGDPLNDERQALLYSLRPYANSDGTIPRQFWELVRDAFAGLLE